MRCKIKGKPDSAEAVVLVNDYLTKRACNRFLRLDMQVCIYAFDGKMQLKISLSLKNILFSFQMWDIAHLENRNGHCNIFLKYLGFITQRWLSKVLFVFIQSQPCSNLDFAAIFPF